MKCGLNGHAVTCTKTQQKFVTRKEHIMSVINQLKEKRNHIVAQATLLVTADMNAETRAKVDAMYVDADALKGDIDRAERAEAMEAELRSVKPLPASPLGNEGSEQAVGSRLSTPEYKSAYESYLRRGKAELTQAEVRELHAGQAEIRTQSGATGASGGFTVPTTLADSIEVALKYYGGMRQNATILKTSGGGILNWPTNNDTTNVGAILSGAASEQDLVFGTIPFTAYTYTTKQIPVQNELLQDSAFPLEDLIRSQFVERIGRIQNTHFTVGVGTTQPTGIITAATAGITAATGGSTSVTYANLVDIVHSVDIAYRNGAKFMFNDLTLAAARKLVDTQGRPLLGLGINGGDPDSILGYKFVLNNDVPVMAANAKSIVFGQLSKYMIRDVANSLQILRLDQIQATSNQTVFVGFVRADGNLLDAGTHPATYFSNSAT
jgi:HK97 family phage major capsid protein